MKFIKMCKHCGHYFETNSPQKIYCNLQHYRPCPVCGKATAMIDNDFSRPQRCCSTECTHKLRQTRFKKRKCVLCGKEFQPTSGCNLVCTDTHYRACVICGTPFVIDGTNYRERFVCSSECSKEKKERYCMKVYGVKHPMQSEIGQKHFHEALKRKYGFEHALQVPEFKLKAARTNLQNLGVEHACLASVCRNAGPVHISSVNKAFQTKLESLGTICELEHSILRRAYDIYIPASETLIEINPTYTHNAIGNHYTPIGLDKYYHRDKSQWAIDHGYNCIHIWDWDKKQILAKMLAPRIQVSCDEFSIYKLNLSVTNDFLDENHYLGKCKGQLLCLGLVKGGEVYQVMTFGKPKFDKSHAIQLYRMCTKLGYDIIGGYSKLSQFASELGLYDIIAYADFAKTNGSEYESIGMKFVRQTQPRLIWSKDSRYINSSLIISGKSKYREDAELIADGWLPVYDCGQKVYAFD